MNFLCTSVNLTKYINNIVKLCPLSAPILSVMENNTSLQMTTLLKRLDEAERRSRLLALEVKSIREQIRLIRTTASVNAGPSTSGIVTRIADEPGMLEAKRMRLDDNEKIIVYVDGACENNGKPNAKAGIGVWFNHNDPKNISKPVQGRATNNTAEIQACIAAVECCIKHGHKKIHIKTDSQFTINCMTRWIENWKNKNWMKADGKPVINKEDLEVLDRLCSQVEIQWEHVKGHAGIIGNEEADKLARAGALAYNS